MKINKLTKVEMKNSNFFKMIETYKWQATFSTHDYSNAEPGDTYGISDLGVLTVLKKVEAKEPVIEFTISDMEV